MSFKFLLRLNAVMGMAAAMEQSASSSSMKCQCLCNILLMDIVLVL